MAKVLPIDLLALDNLSKLHFRQSAPKASWDKCFLWLEIPPEHRLATYQSGLAALRGGPGTRILKALDLHMTLLFIGTIAESNRVRAVQIINSTVRNSQAPTMYLTRLGRFKASASSNNKDILHAQVNEGKLRQVYLELVKRFRVHKIPITDVFGFAMPHISLAYLSQDSHVDLSQPLFHTTWRPRGINYTSGDGTLFIPFAP